MVHVKTQYGRIPVYNLITHPVFFIASIPGLKGSPSIHLNYTNTFTGQKRKAPRGLRWRVTLKCPPVAGRSSGAERKAPKLYTLLIFAVSFFLKAVKF